MLSCTVLNTSGAGLPKVLSPAPSAGTNGKETEHWQMRFVVVPAHIAEWNWKVHTTRKRVFKEIEYFSMITTCKSYQVIRFFFTKAYYKVGQPAEYTIDEVAQRWIAPNR